MHGDGERWLRCAQIVRNPMAHFDWCAVLLGWCREPVLRRQAPAVSAAARPSRGFADGRRDSPTAGGGRSPSAEAVTDYEERALPDGVAPWCRPRSAGRVLLDAVAGYGPLQRYLDDPSVEAFWIN
jgi:hypothetical protein